MENTTAQIPSASTSGKKNLITVILILLIVLVVLMAGICLYLLRVASLEKSNEDTQENELVKDTKTTDDTTTDSVKEVFYSNEGTIYSINLATSKVTKWTSEPEEFLKTDMPDSADNLTVIDDNTVGFSKCHVIMNNFRCGIYYLDLETNKVGVLKKIPGAELLSVVGFGSRSLFAYISESDAEWKFAVVEDGDQTVVEKLPTNMGGRGGNMEDSSKIRFSPDNLHVFFIETASPKNIVDLNVYIFDMKSLQKQTIQKATHPEWLSNTQIVFRRPDEGLYLYSLTSEGTKKITPTDDSAYRSSVSDGRVVYETSLTKNKVYLLSKDLKSTEVLLASADSPLFAMANTVVYNELQPCPAKGCDLGMFDDEIHDIIVKVYDWNTGKKVTIPDLSSTWSVAYVR